MLRVAQVESGHAAADVSEVAAELHSNQYDSPTFVHITQHHPGDDVSTSSSATTTVIKRDPGVTVVTSGDLHATTRVQHVTSDAAGGGLDIDVTPLDVPDQQQPQVRSIRLVQSIYMYSEGLKVHVNSQFHELSSRLRYTILM